MKRLIASGICFILFCGTCIGISLRPWDSSQANTGAAISEEEPIEDFIKWVDFEVPTEAMQKAGQADIDTYYTEEHVDWMEALAHLAVQYGGNWSSYQGSHLDEIISALKEGRNPTKEKGYSEDTFSYYLEAYQAVLSGFIGEYQAEEKDDLGNSIVISRYGVKVFSPIAGGYGYSHYDDFGNGRSYGFARKHLGNDLMGTVGTPIIAVETGVIEAMSWNQYGGWRVGIRSLDGQRYYYYAHLRSGHPFANTLREGDTVMAGDVIGYLGMTGYSTTEDTDGMQKPHLHFGMQLIFDESQKEGDNEIWINVYHIVQFLQKHRSYVEIIDGYDEYERTFDYYDTQLDEISY